MAVLPLNVAYTVLGRWLFGGIVCKVRQQSLVYAETFSFDFLVFFFCSPADIDKSGISEVLPFGVCQAFSASQKGHSEWGLFL